METKCRYCKPYYVQLGLCNEKKCFFEQRARLPEDEVKQGEIKGVPNYKGPEIKPKKSIWDKPIVRTLTGRNRAGKAVYGVVGSLLGINIITPQPMDIIQTLDVMEIGFMFAGLVITAALTYFVTRGWISEQVKAETKEVFEAVKKAKSAKSEGGETITKDELNYILDEAFDVVEQVLEDKLGITYDLDQDGK